MSDSNAPKKEEWDEILPASDVASGVGAERAVEFLSKLTGFESDDEDVESGDGDGGSGSGDGDSGSGDGDSGSGEGDSGSGEGGSGSGEGEANLDLAPINEILDGIEGVEEITDVNSLHESLKGLVQKFKDTKAALDEEVEANRAFLTLMESNEDLVTLLKTMNHEKIGLPEALALLYEDPSELVIPDKTRDPEAYANYLVAKKERERQKAENDKLAKQRQDTLVANQAKTRELTKAFQAKNKLTTDQVGKVTTKIQSFLNDMANGLIPEELLDAVHKSINFDETVAKARAEAEAKGKTQAAIKGKDARKGDGLPRLKGAGAQKKASSDWGVQGLAAAAKQSGSLGW